MDEAQTPQDSNSLDSFIQAQENRHRAFRAMAADIWALFIEIDQAFMHALPSFRDTSGTVLLFLVLGSEARRSFRNAASLVSRFQPSEPFAFCRRACEAAMHAMLLSGLGPGSPAFEVAGKAWFNRSKDWKTFNKHFKGRHLYRSLPAPAAELVQLFGSLSEFGSHATAHSTGLHVTEPASNEVLMGSFATDPRAVRRFALDIARVFLVVLDALLPALAAVGIDTSKSSAIVLDAKARLKAILDAAGPSSQTP